VFEPLLDRGLIPDWLIRIGIRRMLGQRLIEETRRDGPAWRREIAASPLATHTTEANQQHYEVPTKFFLRVLGPRRKYSSCYYKKGRETLAEGEEAMLALTCQRAELVDVGSILELGCGWGSLSLYMAARYPAAAITAVSNSRTQKEFIDAEAARLGIRNLQVVTADMLHFAPEGLFDRVVSVEMFEHMRNYDELFRRITGWLASGGKLFVHVFTHARFAYPYETEREGDWMAQHFFSGGQMPSDRLLIEIQGHLRNTGFWRINGRHYARTCEQWLANMDAALPEIRVMFEACYGAGQSGMWIERWRVFFMACAELFAYHQGEEWGVCHYLFEK